MKRDNVIQQLADAVGANENESDEDIMRRALFYISVARGNEIAPTKVRGLEEIFQNVGTAETVLAAFLLQLLAQHSKDMISKIIEFVDNLDQEDSKNEQKEVPDSN